MNPEVKEKWVAALRSGDYVQGIGQLRRSNKFCCLGVLCNLHAQAHPEIAASQTDANEYFGAVTDLPRMVRDWAGFDNFVSERVSIAGVHSWPEDHNDSGRTFLEIADAIERQL